jgi:hypothetical protein
MPGQEMSLYDTVLQNVITPAMTNISDFVKSDDKNVSNTNIGGAIDFIKGASGIAAALGNDEIANAALKVYDTASKTPEWRTQAQEWMKKEANDDKSSKTMSELLKDRINDVRNKKKRNNSKQEQNSDQPEELKKDDKSRTRSSGKRRVIKG